MTTIRVTGCDMCPFSDTVDSAGHDIDFPTCGAPGTTGDGVLFDDNNVPSTPPEWCPLRGGYVVVQLSAETT